MPVVPEFVRYLGKEGFAKGVGPEIRSPGGFRRSRAFCPPRTGRRSSPSFAPLPEPIARPRTASMRCYRGRRKDDRKKRLGYRTGRLLVQPQCKRGFDRLRGTTHRGLLLQEDEDGARFLRAQKNPPVLSDGFCGQTPRALPISHPMPAGCHRYRATGRLSKPQPKIASVHISTAISGPVVSPFRPESFDR